MLLSLASPNSTRVRRFTAALLGLLSLFAHRAVSQAGPTPPAQMQRQELPLQSLPSAPTPHGVSPKSAEDLPTLSLSESLIQQQKYVDAIAGLRVYVASHGDSWRAHYDLGYALSRVRDGTTSLEGDLRESIGELAHSLQLNIGNADAHRALGVDLTMIQKDDLAEVEFQQAVRYAPGSAENHYLLGRISMSKQRYTAAVQELKQAVQLDPHFMKAYDNLGVALDRLGDQKAALAAAQKAVELDESSGAHSELPHLDLARLYRESGDLDRALGEAKEAAGTNPRSEESLIELGTVYRALQQWNKALVPLQQAVALNSSTPQTYFLLGRTYEVLGRDAESKQAFINFDKYRQLAEAKGTVGARSQP